MHCLLEETAQDSNINYQLRDFEDAFMHLSFQRKMRLHKQETVPISSQYQDKLEGSWSKHSLSIVDGTQFLEGTDPAASSSAEGRSLRFLANVDPIDVKRALHLGLTKGTGCLQYVLIIRML